MRRRPPVAAGRGQASRVRRRHILGSCVALGLMASGARSQSRDVSAGAFGAQSTAEEVTRGLDLSGKTALITGCNSGIGYETMRVLALRGALVFGTARSARKGRQACESVTGDARPLVLELADFDSIVDCASQFAAIGRPLDILICNAGVLLPERERVRGLEKQFVVNHPGHFVLVNRLFEALLAEYLV